MLKHSDTAAFEARGLDAAIADEMGCTFRNGNFRFEYRSQDAVSFTKVRTQDKRFWIEPTGSSLHLWNIDSLRGLSSRPRAALTLTEGEFDSIAVRHACNGFVASVPNGANGHKSEGAIYPGKDTGFQYLWGQNGKLIPELDQFDKIVLATDADEKGYLLRDELALRIGRTRCWFVEYPDGCKDANDVLRGYGAETLAKVIAGAKPIRPGYLVKPGDLPPHVPETAYSTGMAFLDKHIKLVRPELMVITGQPTHGKTQFMRAVTFHLAESHGWRIAYLTPEDNIQRLKRDMGRFARRTGARYADDAGWIDRSFRISNTPEDDPITIDVVEAEMESAALHHDCQVFVIDPWNEISHDYGRLTIDQYIEHALRRFKQKTRRFNMLLIIVAHPTKLQAEQTATLYSINGSANWRNKCDHGIIVHRPFPDLPDVQVITEKTKDQETMGMPGTRCIRFLRSECEYVDAQQLE
jgi:twinkle protein